MTKNWKKVTAEIFFFFLLKKCNLPIPRPPLSMSTLQNMNFYKFLSTFVGHFCPPRSGSGSTNPIESGSGSTTLIFTVLWLLYYFLSLKNDVNVWYLQNVISKKTRKFFLFFVGVLVKTAGSGTRARTGSVSQRSRAGAGSVPKCLGSGTLVLATT